MSNQTVANPLNRVPTVAILFTLVIKLIFASLYAWMVIWLHSLSVKGCTCAMTWKKTFLEVMFAIALLLLVASFFVTIPLPLAILSSLFLIVGVVITRIFIIEIKRDDECACADTLSLQTLNILNYIQIFMLVLVVLATVALLFRGKSVKKV